MNKCNRSTVFDYKVLNDPDGVIEGEIWKLEYQNRDWRMYKKYVGLIVKHSEPGMIVDVGCGLGFFVECCSRYGLPCIGIEGDLTAIEMAQQRHPNLDLRQGFIEDALPFDDNTVSVVFCNQVIEHLEPETARYLLKEAYRILQDQGQLFLFSPCLYNPEERKKPSHINLYTPKKLSEEVQVAGFQEIIPLDYPRPFLGSHKLFRLIAGALFLMIPIDYYSSSANLIAIKRKEQSKFVGHSVHYFHLNRLLTW